MHGDLNENPIETKGALSLSWFQYTHTLSYKDTKINEGGQRVFSRRKQWGLNRVENQTSGSHVCCILDKCFQVHTIDCVG